MKQSLNIFLSLILMIGLTTQTFAATKNQDLATPPPGTQITKDNTIYYINEAGQEVFVGYKSGKIKKTEIKRDETETSYRRFRGTNYRPKIEEVEEDLLASASKEETETSNNKSAVKSHYRRVRNVSAAEKLSQIRTYKESNEENEIIHRIAEIKKSKSRIQDKITTDFTSLQDAYKNNKAQRAQLQMEANKAKYDTSRIQKKIEMDLAELIKAKELTKAEKINQEMDKKIARSLRDLDE